MFCDIYLKLSKYKSKLHTSKLKPIRLHLIVWVQYEMVLPNPFFFCMMKEQGTKCYNPHRIFPTILVLYWPFATTSRVPSLQHFHFAIGQLAINCKALFNLFCFSLITAFVNKSANMSLVSKYIVSMTLISIFSLMKWCQISMFLVLAWCFGFFDSARHLQLSHFNGVASNCTNPISSSDNIN
jgi:hypothetical protein